MVDDKKVTETLDKFEHNGLISTNVSMLLRRDLFYEISYNPCNCIDCIMKRKGEKK